MVGNHKEITEEEAKLWEKIWKLDPMFFLRGYSKDEINRILKENGIIES